jgi:hypothetical protein
VGDNLAAEVGRRRSSIPARSEAKSGAGRPGYAYHLRSRYTYWLTLCHFNGIMVVRPAPFKLG